LKHAASFTKVDDLFKKCGFGLLKRVFVKKEISIFSLGVPAIFIKNIFLVQL
jgi:hypothetical protein